MPRLASLAAVCFTALGLAMPPAAKALPSLFGGQIYYTGGNVTIDVLGNNTVFDEVLQLRSALTTFDVIDGSRIGSQVILTAEQLAGMGIAVGDELLFGIHVRNTGQTFFLGSGDRNADGLDHAYVRSGRGSVHVGFEDLLGGGDLDYNDAIFRFSSGTTTQSFVTVAEPSMLLLLIPGIGLLALGRRRK